SAEVIVVTTLIGDEGLNNRNFENSKRCGKCNESRKQKNLATVKGIMWNMKSMTECIVLLMAKRTDKMVKIYLSVSSKEETLIKLTFKLSEVRERRG
ncbi:TPA: hypothetical protein I0I20_RS14210, partial [Enterococcus faecium]